MARVDPNQVARELAAGLPRNRWIVAKAMLEEPYPCRCRERPAWARGKAEWTCSPAWCPCAGRPDPQEPECCGWRVSPAQVVMAKAAWDLQRRNRDGLMS